MKGATNPRAQKVLNAFTRHLHAFIEEVEPTEEEWEWDAIRDAVFKQFNFRIPPPDEDTLDGLNADGLGQMIFEAALAVYRQKEADMGPEALREIERIIMLQAVDDECRGVLGHASDGSRAHRNGRRIRRPGRAPRRAPPSGR